MESDFEANITPVDGNVAVEMNFDGLRVSFVAAPDKVRHLAKVMIAMADEADAEMPKL